ncbi:MAG: LysR family transcriptional regulator [Bacillota bacterium]
MLYQQLNVFKVVAENGNITLAAKKLHMSQPSISLQIQSLENHYGVILFNRSNKGVYLTEAGKLLYQYSIKILDLLQEAQERVAELGADARATITLEATFTVGEYLAPRIMGYLYQTRPELEVKLKIANTETTYQDVLEKNVQLGLIEGPVQPHRELVVEKFWEDELVVVVPYFHNWAKRDKVSLEELREEKIILREEGSGTRKVVENALAARGLNIEEMNVAMELGSIQAIKEVVAAGLGVSILSSLTVRKNSEAKLFRTLQIEGGPIARPLSLVRHATAHQGPHVLFVVDLLHDHEKLKSILAADSLVEPECETIAGEG